MSTSTTPIDKPFKRIRVTKGGPPPGDVATVDVGWVPRRDGKRAWFLPFHETVVPARGHATMSAQPCVPFHPVRLSLVAPEDVLRRDTIGVGSIQVARDHWAIASETDPDGIPARFFPVLPLGLSEDEKEVYEEILSLHLPVMDVGSFMMVGVTNHEDEDVRVKLVCWGDFPK